MRTLQLLACVALIAGCSSSSSSQSNIEAYTGVWDVRYNLSEDGCSLVTEGILGIVDRHTINASEIGVSFSAESGLVGEATVPLNEDGSFSVTSTGSGDFFGDGSTCTLLNTISYSLQEEGLAQTFFTETLNCSDGYQCQSRGVGSARKVSER